CWRAAAATTRCTRSSTGSSPTSSSRPGRATSRWRGRKPAPRRPPRPRAGAWAACSGAAARALPVPLSKKFEPSFGPARLRGRQTGGRCMRKAWLAGLGLLLLPALPAVGDEWTHQYQLKGRPELRVTTDDGSVQIETSDRREIGARVTTGGWRIAPDEVTITETQTGDRVEIEVKVPHERWGMNFGHRDIKVALQVPREAELDSRTGDGSVRVPPVSGNVRIFTGDGSITADGLQG